MPKNPPMNMLPCRLACCSIWLLLATGFVLRPAHAAVITYPAPPGEAVTSDYAVTVDGRPVDVYAAQTQHFEGDYYFASFDFSGKVAIRVTSPESLENVAIEPARFGVQLQRDSAHEITLTADKPFRISVERNGRIKPLVLFGNALETDAPRPGDANVVYFAPGVHRPGKITLADNQTPPCRRGRRGERLRPRQGKEHHDPRPRHPRRRRIAPLPGAGPVSVGLPGDCQDLTVRDITLRNPFSRTFVTWNCDRVMIDNVKICSSRMINDDALDLVNTQNATVRNCFFRTQDDSIAIKGNGEDAAALREDPHRRLPVLDRLGQHLPHRLRM